MPLITQTAAGYFTAHNATIVGDVTIGQLSSFWFATVVRGDVAAVHIGQRVNLQDGAIIHCDTGEDNIIEDDVSIAHGAVVHGQFVGRGTLIGMNATVLGRTRIGSQCLIAAGTVLSPGTEVPDRTVVMGVPGEIVRPVREQELQYMTWVRDRYIELAHQYIAGRFKSATE